MFERTRVRKMTVALAIVAAAMLLFSALAGSGVYAAKGGSTSGSHGGKGGGGGGGTTGGTASCAVAPNPATLYSQVSITGSGYAPNTSYGMSITNSSGSSYMGFVGSDGSGNIATTYNTVWTGTNTVKVSGGGLSATCSFNVN